MIFDQHNKIVKLCAQGMALEAEGKDKEALRIFEQAWNSATNDFERFTSAHYLARHQRSVGEKLKWDNTSLKYALRIDDEKVKGSYPSLYLNVGKCYEDLGDIENALTNYESALTFVEFLVDDQYGQMVMEGIRNGLERLRQRAAGRDHHL